MKKIFFIISSVFAALFIMSFAANNTSFQQENSHSSVVDAVGVRTVTAYKITMVGSNVASKESVSAEFDSDKMELRVVEKRGGRKLVQPYSVTRNPYKGYKDDPRGSYEYYAGGYYFN